MSTDTQTATPKAHGWRGQVLQLAAVVLAVFLAKGAFAEPFYVPSGSMEPTLLIGDALLASKYPYGYSAASLPIQITLPETGRVFGGMPKAMGSNSTSSTKPPQREYTRSGVVLSASK